MKIGSLGCDWQGADEDAYKIKTKIGLKSDCDLNTAWEYMLKRVVLAISGLFLGLFVLYSGTQWFVVISNYNKCKSNILRNESEAIGALKYALLRDRDYSEILIEQPIPRISSIESSDHDLPNGWKITAHLEYNGEKTSVEYFVTECAEIWDY